LYAAVNDIDSNGLTFHRTVDFIYLAGIIFEVLSIIILVLLIIGVFKKKVILMKPFNVVYLLYIITIIIKSIYLLIESSKWESSDMDSLLGLINAFYIISAIVNTIYYIITMNYIHNIEKELNDLKYEEAVKDDHRLFLEYYIDLLKCKHILIKILHFIMQ